MVLKLKVGKSDVWNPDKTLNIPALGSGAYPIMKIQCSSHGDLPDVADEWRSCSSGWLPEDAEQRKWFAGIASAKVAAGASQEILPAEVAAGAPSVEVAADAYPAKNIKTQRQMAGQMTSSVWHLLTQWHRRCQSDSCSKYPD